MKLNRRFFLKTGLVTLLPAAVKASEKKEKNGESLQVGCLVDTTLCIGCRQCEKACNRSNGLPRPEVPFSSPSVFLKKRRPTTEALTVVNRYEGNPSPDQAKVKNTNCKIQCMHCIVPSCVSACVVGAMKKLDDGTVIYNKNICLGCRYCMIACPFEIPAYEYTEPLAPKVKKCIFCADLKGNKGAKPACAGSCPTEALVFGKRKDLLTLARHRIEKRPDRYQDHIYGEKEVGGTSWLYLTGRPFEELDLIRMENSSPALRTENIQHGIFKFGIIPFTLYGLLAGIMWRNKKKEKKIDKTESGEKK